MTRTDEGGMILLDALLALAILASAIVALVSLGASAARAFQHAHAEERQMADAHRLLGALRMLTRTEYDQRLGLRAIGSYLVEVERPERGLYRVSIRLEDDPAAELLATVVYRGEPFP